RSTVSGKCPDAAALSPGRPRPVARVERSETRGERPRMSLRSIRATISGDSCLGWNNNTVEVIGLPIEFEGGADMKSEIGRRAPDDFPGRNGNPRAVHLHLIVVVDLPP